MRWGQLSMIAGAIEEPAMSASDCVAKTTETFRFRSTFSHSRMRAAKSGLSRIDPGLVEHQQRRPSIEPLLKTMEQ